MFWIDIPKFLTNHTIYYSWEGNPVNISCDVMSNPPATMLWRRERFTISAEGTANTRVHSVEGKSVLEVGTSASLWSAYYSNCRPEVHTLLTAAL